MIGKADYVRSQGQTRSHHCHWPGCDKQVPPAMWGCKAHWFRLPANLRSMVWSTYRPGQEIDGTPSRLYLEVARKVRDWIGAQGVPPASDSPAKQTDQITPIGSKKEQST